MTDTQTTTPTPLPRFGDDGFVAAYGAAWSDTETLMRFFAQDVVYEDKVSGVSLTGHAVMRKFMKVYARFSPDCVVDFTRVVEGEGCFAAEWDWYGTGTGQLRLPDGTTDAGGKRFNVPGMSLCTIDGDGLVATHTDYWDGGTLLRQLRG